MAMAATLVVVRRSPREAVPRAQVRVQHRLAAVLRRFLSELAALPDRGKSTQIRFLLLQIRRHRGALSTP